MTANEFEQEVHFGLENLTRVRSNIIHILSQDVDEIVRRSALTYECFGYYNAFEHLILRFIKFFEKRAANWTVFASRGTTSVGSHGRGI